MEARIKEQLLRWESVNWGKKSQRLRIWRRDKKKMVTKTTDWLRNEGTQPFIAVKTTAWPKSFLFILLHIYHPSLKWCSPGVQTLSATTTASTLLWDNFAQIPGCWGVKACKHTLSEMWLFSWGSAISNTGHLKIPQRKKKSWEKEGQKDVYHHPPVQGKDRNKPNGSPQDAAIC